MAARLALVAAAGLWVALAGCGSDDDGTAARPRPPATLPTEPADGASADEAEAVACTLSIHPPDATIVLSRQGAVVGEYNSDDEPLTVALAPGVYTIEAFKDGYGPFIDRVTFDRDTTTFAGRLTPVLAELIVRSDPGVAIEAVDDQGRTIPLGKTDADGVRYISSLVEGTYTLRLTRPDHAPATRTVTLKRGRSHTVKAAPTPKPEAGH